MRGLYPSITMKYFARRNMSYFRTIFFSCIQRATRTRSGDGPTIVPASSRIAQSVLPILSGWMGTRSFEGLLLKRPTASLRHPRATTLLVSVAEITEKLHDEGK